MTCLEVVLAFYDCDKITKIVIVKTGNARQQCHKSLVPAEAGRSRELEASLVYRENSRTARDTQRNPFSKNQKTKK